MTQEIDKSNLKNIIINSYKQFEYGINQAGAQKINQDDFDSIVVCGMGGSQMPGYFLELCVDLKIPVINHTDYGIPERITKNPLFVITSFSGNTEETLDSYNQVKILNKEMIVLTNGGLLQTLAEKNHDICINYSISEPSFQPRCATPMATAALVSLLENSGIIKDGKRQIRETAEFIKNHAGEHIAQEGKRISKLIFDRIPVYYASYTYRYVAMINKIKVNENSKLLAYWNYYPELNHNELNGYQNDRRGRFIVIVLQDNDPNQVKNFKRSKITTEMLQEKGYEIVNVDLKGETKLQKAFYGFSLGDWISYYLALKQKQDPIPVPMVEEFKKRMES